MKRLGLLGAVVLVVSLLTAVPAHAVEPTGGCWVWYAGTPQRDISSRLAPWANEDADPEGPADHRISLSPEAPAAGSEGTITYRYNKGPENAGPAAQVTGTFRFSVNGGEPITKTVDYGTVSTGETIPGRKFTLPFTVEAGENVVVFEGVTFDASPFQVKIDCNGQENGTAESNPRTDPQPTNVRASVTSSGVAPGYEPPAPGGDGACLLPIQIPLLCSDDGAEEPEPSEPGDPEDPEEPVEGGAEEPGLAPGAGAGAPGSPATGKVDFDCVLQPFNSSFDYQPSASVAGARPSAGAPVDLLARFGDLPGIAPVPIDGRMDTTVELTVGGKPTTVTGSSDVSVPPETAVPVPDLVGAVGADGDSLPVTVTSFAFSFPDYSIDATCSVADGGDLGVMGVGSGSIGGGASAPGSAAPAGVAPDGTTPSPVTADVAGAGQQDISVVDVRFEGSRGLGELFGGAAERTLVIVVQNVGADPVESPAVALAMSASDDAEPQPLAAAVGTLAPNQMQRIEVPVRMPRAGIGSYAVSGQVGATAAGSFTTSTQTIPWGLLLLNVGAIACFGWGLRRRLRHPVATPHAGAGPADDVPPVDLDALDRWWRRRPALA